MSQNAASSPPKQRPEYRNINAFTDLTTYRLPPAGWVSILHRLSGVVLFFALPLLLCVWGASLRSPQSYAQVVSVFNEGCAWIPGWFLKLLALALIWAFVHHLLAGLRHLYMDATHKVSKEFGKTSAWVVLGLSALITLSLAAKLFGMY